MNQVLLPAHCVCAYKSRNSRTQSLMQQVASEMGKRGTGRRRDSTAGLSSRSSNDSRLPLVPAPQSTDNPLGKHHVSWPYPGQNKGQGHATGNARMGEGAPTHMQAAVMQACLIVNPRGARMERTTKKNTYQSKQPTNFIRKSKHTAKAANHRPLKQ